MRLRRGPQFASVIFALVVVLAVGALAWGATHNKSQGDGVGSAKDQKAARATLTALQLPAGFARDASFTACGNVADTCFTGNAPTSETLTALSAMVHSAGGSLPDVCSATITSTDNSANAGPRFTCGVQGRLNGTEVFFLLGDAWLLPGNPTPKTAILATVVSGTTPPVASPHDPKPGTEADVAALLPATWASAPQACAGGSAAPASTAASSAPAGSAPASTPALVTAPPLPACAAAAITNNVSVHLALAAAAAQLSKLAVASGFRIDGHPCLAGSTPTNCEVRGEHITSGAQQLFVANLTDDGRGNTVGTLAVTRQTQQK